MILEDKDIARLERLINGWLDENPPLDESNLMNEEELAWLAQRAIFTIRSLQGHLERYASYSSVERTRYLDKEILRYSNALVKTKKLCDMCLLPKTIETTLCDNDTSVDRETKFYNAGWDRGIKAIAKDILKTLDE